MKQPGPLIYLRSALFYLLFVAFTILWSCLVMVVAPTLPYRQRFQFAIGGFTRTVIWLLRWTCGIRWRIHGLENIPAEPCVLYAKHQSTWETFFLQTLFAPQTQVIKKELLGVPFFGWAFALLAPIAIDRSRRKRAMQQVLEQGRKRMEAGIWVLIFPEGTRVDPGQTRPFTHGGARLAQATGRPLLPIAHNAGLYWPNNHFAKFPGCIDLVIGKPIEPEGKTVEALTAEGEAWINRTAEALANGTWQPPETEPATPLARAGNEPVNQYNERR